MLAALWRRRRRPGGGRQRHPHAACAARLLQPQPKSSRSTLPDTQENRKFEIWNVNVDDTADLNLRATGTVVFGANALL